MAIQLPANGTGTVVETVTPAGIAAGTEREVVALGAADTASTRMTGTVVGTKAGLDVNLVASAGGNANTTGTITTTGNTVVATVGQMGNGTIVLFGGTYTQLTLAFEASLDNTNWFPVDVVRADGSATILGAVGETFTGAGIRAWNFMCPGYAQVRARVVTMTSTVAANIWISQGPFLYDPSPTVPPSDGNKPTYVSALNQTNVAAAVTASVPVWELVNAGTKTVRVIRLSWQLTLATAGAAPLIHLNKRTVASTGGTAVTQTVGPIDGPSPASSVTSKYYTAGPTVAGALSATIRQSRQFAPATVLTVTPPLTEWTFGNRPSQAVVLRPGESMSLVPQAAFGTAPTITGDVEWTEE